MSSPFHEVDLPGSFPQMPEPTTTDPSLPTASQVQPNSSSGTGGKPPLPTPPPTPPKTSKDSSDSDNEKAKGNGNEDGNNNSSNDAHTNKIEATPSEHPAVPKLRSCRHRKPSPYPHAVRVPPSVDSSSSSGRTSDEEEWDSDDEASEAEDGEDVGVDGDESQDGNAKGGDGDGQGGETGEGAGKVGGGEGSAGNGGSSRHARVDEEGEDGYEDEEEDESDFGSDIDYDSDDYLYDDEDLLDASTQDQDHNNPNTDPSPADGNEDLNVVQLLDRILMSMTRNEPAVPAAPVNMHFRPDTHPSAQRRAELRDRLTNRGDDAYDIGYEVGLREAAMRRILTPEEWHALAVQTISYCPGCPWCSQWMGYRGQGSERRGYGY